MSGFWLVFGFLLCIWGAGMVGWGLRELRHVRQQKALRQLLEGFRYSASQSEALLNVPSAEGWAFAAASRARSQAMREAAEFLEAILDAEGRP